MKKIIVVVKDEKAGFLNPVAMDNEPIAIRHFRNLAEDKTSAIISSNPEDFSLYQIGEFDTFSGEITSSEPKLICRADEFVRGEEQ